ncbi:MAG: ankyrin repeat domain-containing protein [Candidatus Eremiobacteraeota bacterium]|nr:ankyrin repeat domain-containing protein [Candidatus Eremiobacteraeota bacterium]
MAQRVIQAFLGLVIPLRRMKGGFLMECPWREKRGFLSLAALVFLFLVLLNAQAAAKDIFQAVQDGDLATVKALLRKNPSLARTRNAAGETPLHRAAAGGFDKAITCLLSSGAGINEKDRKGNTPLHSAIPACSDRGVASPEIAEFLIKKGASLNEKNLDGLTPLLLALEKGEFLIAAFLVKSGADVHTADREKNTPLHHAAAALYDDIVIMLVKKGAQVNSRNLAGDTPLMMAAHSGPSEVATFLLSHGASKDIFSCAGLGDTKTMAVLLKKAPDLARARDGSGDTPLHYAAYAGQKSAVKLLLSQGADVNAQSKSLWTPLHNAALKGDSETASFLLEKGARVDIKNADGETPLSLAEMNGHGELVKLMSGRK